MTMTFSASASTSARGTGSFPEVYNSSRFWVEISGILEAYFVECSGLTITTEVMEYKEGGLNSYTHKLPVRTSYTNLTLKRGLTNSFKFWDWYKKSINGKPEKLNISIILYSADVPGSAQRRWDIQAAYPIKWSGPQFNAKSGEYTIETIELAYDWFKMVL